jgi:chromosomal replication initiation ATPase DnaA
MWANDSTNFLEEVSEKPFFINGKAGSGKSTLMKFICDDARTKNALKRWAGANELVTLQFFFWNLGTNVQKSHAGLLRGLLHAALEQNPELIPAVFPKA